MAGREQAAQQARRSGKKTSPSRPRGIGRGGQGSSKETRVSRANDSRVFTGWPLARLQVGGTPCAVLLRSGPAAKRKSAAAETKPSSAPATRSWQIQLASGARSPCWPGARAKHSMLVASQTLTTHKRGEKLDRKGNSILQGYNEVKNEQLFSINFHSKYNLFFLGGGAFLLIPIHT